MANDFKTDGVVAFRGSRAGVPVEKIEGARNAQMLPERGEVLPQKQEAESAGPENIEQAVSMMNQHVQQINRQLEFSVDDELGRVVITVRDSDTEEVIRQIPSEEALNFARRFAESADLELIDRFA